MSDIKVIDVDQLERKKQFIRINGVGHGIGDKVATVSFQYFINDYLRELPQMISSTSKGARI